MKLANSSDYNALVAKIDGQSVHIDPGKVKDIGNLNNGISVLELVNGDEILWKGVVPTMNIEIDPDNVLVRYQGLSLPSIVAKKTPKTTGLYCILYIAAAFVFIYIVMKMIK